MNIEFRIIELFTKKLKFYIKNHDLDILKEANSQDYIREVLRETEVN